MASGVNVILFFIFCDFDFSVDVGEECNYLDIHKLVLESLRGVKFFHHDVWGFVRGLEVFMVNALNQKEFPQTSS